MQYLVIALGLLSVLGIVILLIHRRRRQPDLLPEGMSQACVSAKSRAEQAVGLAAAQEGNVKPAQVPTDVSQEAESQAQPTLPKEVEGKTGRDVQEALNEGQPQTEGTPGSRQLTAQATELKRDEGEVLPEAIAAGCKERPPVEMPPASAPAEIVELPNEEKDNAASQPELDAHADATESSNGTPAAPVTILVHRPPSVPTNNVAVKTPGTNEERNLPDYTPPPVKPPKLRPRRIRQPSAGGAIQAAEIRMQLFFDRHNFLQRIVFLARRPEDGAEEVEVRILRKAGQLIAVGDDWYEIEQTSEIGRLLDEGFEISAGSERDASRWQHRRRDIYVLACQQGFASFVSTTRLRLGCEQVVFCRASRAQEVAAVLVEAGCESLTSYSKDHGAPEGWVFFKPVVPRISLPAQGDGDILDILRPQPDIEIDFRGGVWLEGNAWLAGYPPEIRVFGELPSGTDVLIDDQVATRGPDGIFTVPGYEQPGQHQIWCGGRTGTYSIEEPREDWEAWDAHVSRFGTICGALARTDLVKSSLVTVPTSNRLLVGALPGEIFLCRSRPGSTWIGFVPFDVVWALPPDPFHCNKASVRVFLLKLLPPRTFSTAPARASVQARAMLSWSSAIRNCCRKGLRVEPDGGESKRLWDDYQRQAKAVWKLLK